jgi:hypothetical protein
MPPRRGLNFVWVVILQRCRAYGATAGRGRRSRVRLARAVRFPAGANVAQAFGHDAAGGGRNINANHGCGKHANLNNNRISLLT